MTRRRTPAPPPDPDAIGPADFDPYRADIRDCACDVCNEVAYALSNVLDFTGARHRAAARNLLDVLRAGQHRHVSYAERAAIARAEKAVRLAAAIANGASASHIAAIERGYATVKMSDFYATGMGLGMTPRRGVA